MAQTFSMSPRGPFDLAYQQGFFGGWPPFEPDPSAVAMAFPVEGWTHSAAVVLRQPEAGRITGEVHGADGETARAAWEQALAVLSLDVDGTDFPAVGERDPVVGRLQAQHRLMRPTLFHSPYEAACNFVIGQRISIVQARALRARMAVEEGDRISAGGAQLHAFPRPQALLQLESIRGLPDEKVTRLQGIAEAALAGVLDRARLRSLPVEDALAELSSLRGVGPFSSVGIVFRGAGVVDDVTDEPVTKQAVQRLYSLDHLPDQAEVLRIAESWRPFRMWSLVLLHVWIRGEGGGPERPSRAGRDRRHQ
ncbi:MAG: DNA-3-methyladenine glycosylase 2 family protein [Candidatus Dormibacteraeota bacterium]|uniref:DNA-3-methyladenine glycosylase 2 family protein n=1 Tax=Candidatus Amunia macphersoniae TaxID=3127014 RepID=A0A934KNE6_9BACT|nr:DNA-3-methyladenine glycosylase 2 family protein [Candidatus Dormibacteraeota bacterium]